MSNIFKTLVTGIVLTGSLSFASPGFAKANQAQDQQWFATFSASPQGNVIFFPPAEIAPLAGQTVRNMVRISQGGDTVRVRLSNGYGDVPVTFTAASVGVAAQGSAIQPGTLRSLTFSGNASVKVAPGAEVYSDPVSLTVADDSDLAVNIYVDGVSPKPTINATANKSSWLSLSGDYTAQTQMPANAALTTVSYFVSGVDVLSQRNSKTIVTVGDSITVSLGASFDADTSYPNALARRILATEGMDNTTVANAGISGNRLLANGQIFGQAVLTRLDSDILSEPGISHILLLIGTNDIGLPEVGFLLPEGDDVEPVSANDLITGMKQLIQRAHDRGVKVIGGTILPYKGGLYYTAEGNDKREAVNNWIRNSGAFDGVVDFDAALRDPNDPLQLNPALHIGDFLHPNDAGYQKMADAVDLKLFK